jgi:glycosyltransferase involved in cell wall biosynthesis
LAISASAARDIVACYPDIDASKIAITPLGVDSGFFEGNHIQQPCVTKPYFLYVGNRRSYKNFGRLLAAFGQSGLARVFDLRVISPGGGFSADEAARVEQYQLRDSIQLQTNADERTLRESYANAVALIYPSEYEGFGLPVIEALASGTLVAASDVASMPEVGGDVAFYFDPRSAESIADSLHRIVGLSAEQRTQRIEQGVARAHTFTWERCQEQTLAVFRELM